jgi:hypothetical protein
MLIFPLSNAFAAKADCLPTSVECSYYQGMPQQGGLYIKMETQNARGGSTVTHCNFATSTNGFTIAYAPQYLGANHQTFSVCRDIAGSDCTKIISQDYTVSLVNGQYKANPMYLVINVSAYRDNFPICDHG